MAEYANIDIIARRLQILIYTVYTIENELVWIGTKRMQMFESGLTLIRRCSSNSCSLLILVLDEKKDATMEETTGITIARGTKHCVLCCSLESNRGEDSFVKLKERFNKESFSSWCLDQCFIVPLIVFNVQEVHSGSFDRRRELLKSRYSRDIFHFLFFFYVRI